MLGYASKSIIIEITNPAWHGLNKANFNEIVIVYVYMKKYDNKKSHLCIE